MKNYLYYYDTGGSILDNSWIYQIPVRNLFLSQPKESNLYDYGLLARWINANNDKKNSTKDNKTNTNTISNNNINNRNIGSIRSIHSSGSKHSSFTPLHLSNLVIQLRP